jgi:GT2 family glycosyltransferase
MSDARPLVSLVILNWRGEDATAQCVDSAAGQDCDARVEIIVVDNQSAATSRERLSQTSADIVVPCSRNLGFGGGMNAGAAVARGVVIGLLNNDLVLAPDWLQHGLNLLAQRPDVAMVGGLSYRWDDKNPLFSEANDASSYHRVDHESGTTTLLREQTEATDVSSLDGSNLLIRRAVWDQLRGFDPDYFAYGEDLDLSARCSAIGWSVAFEPAMRTWHRRNASSDRTPFRRAYRSRRNHLYNVARHFPEREWRPRVRRLSIDYLWCGLAGRTGGLRSWSEATRIGPTERLASVAAGLTGCINAGKLATKRAEVIRLGHHDERWTEKVRIRNGLLHQKGPQCGC